ncbi:lytic polysaccharide monooxygenase [Streptomyces sp. NPDC020125]|uniref:lytic polysaccharide monooxygenase n=1 Tax=Streptomyces sp. NPDC020125 TaxID=3154593 RepID=UPI0033FBAB69
MTSYRTAAVGALLGALPCLLTALAAQPAQAHGAPTDPVSRTFACSPESGAARPLKWSDLEAKPFATAKDPALIDDAYRIRATLPAGRTGRQLLYTIWRNTSTPDTYYSCSDVVLGSKARSSEAPSSEAAAPPSQDAAAASRATSATSATSEEDGGGSTPMLLAGGASVLVLGAGVAAAVRWRRHPRR